MRTVILLTLALAAGAAKAVVPDNAYSHPQKLVVIDGHRKLNIFCLGTGEPTVLFDAGLGGDSLTWRKVQDEIATKTRACSYDRAGYGFSDPSPNPSDVKSIVADIDKLLKAAGIKTPVVYVGHSIAGLYGVALQGRHPEDVAAEVLVDPSVHDQNETYMAMIPAAMRPAVAKMNADMVAQARTCLDLAKNGALTNPADDVAKTCVGLPSRKIDPALSEALARQWASPAPHAANLSETISATPLNGSLSADRVQVEAARSSFGDKPLIILTASESHGTPSLSAEQNARLDAAWSAGHDVLAALSSRGSNSVVPDSSHSIQRDQPQAVIAAIETAIDQVHRAQVAPGRR
jgi:pimeloyl-ACP methyl ester carboxylesterase